MTSGIHNKRNLSQQLAQGSYILIDVTQLLQQLA